MRAILSFFTAALVLTAEPAFAQQPQSGEYRGTEEQQAACTPDVFRLCAWYIPNVDNIVACLRAKVPNLSPACRVVFGAERPPPPQRSAQPRRSPPPQTEGSGASR